MKLHEYIEAAVAVVFIVIGGLGFGWFRILKETNCLLKEQNTELKEENKELKDHRATNIEKLASMQAQIDIIKDIPLTHIDVTLKELAKFNGAIATSNEKILAQLKMTAEIAEEDRDVLTNQNKHIRDEVKKISEE